MVIWIIGLSGAGKTTLAKSIKSDLKKRNIINIWLDGDKISKVFRNDLGYSKEDRFKNSERISYLCKFFEEENINVICSILSNYEIHREWNRENIKNYYEIFIDCPIDQLIKRDNKGIYKDFLKGNAKNVIGMDLKFEVPSNPDMIIQNDGSLNQLLSFSKKISSLFK